MGYFLTGQLGRARVGAWLGVGGRRIGEEEPVKRPWFGGDDEVI